MRFQPLSLLAAILLATANVALAEEYSSGPLTIEHPWARPTPPNATFGVGYMSITNAGQEDVSLVGAKTPRAARVSIHQSRMHMEMMGMEPMPDGLAIPAGETVELKPNGYHLMLENISGSLEEGERIPLTLAFDGAPDVEVELDVRPLDGQADNRESSDHDGMDHGAHQ
ncbi:copper chaperone PCu(A)C [Marinobacter sp.]|uniref:copper chaperone PCu(A)C n=1 Tax=Marinobacter sp. TaxID=50741 RepID=UPI00384CF9FE